MNENKTTIVESSPPVFKATQDGWARSLGEGPRLPLILLTCLPIRSGDKPFSLISPKYS
jgi:hypothetical protein